MFTPCLISLVCIWVAPVSTSSGPAADGLEELIGDSGFEGTLGVDHWYFLTRGVDWDDLNVWAEGSVAVADDQTYVTGKRSLKLTGPATVVSKAFPYHGEKLILSGWMRTEGITCGKSGWAGAGVQFVGLGTDGKQFCHHDLNIAFGTNPWKFYRGEYSFPAAVKKVQVWIRIFDGASGQAWFDDVRLQRVPPKHTVRPFDKKQATIHIDAGKPGRVINHRVWAGVDTGVTYGWWLRDDVQQTLPLLVRAGFELIRNHELSNGLQIYTRDDEQGNGVYDWTRFDLVHDLFVANKLTPIVTIETTPQALDKPGTKRPNYTNTDAPRDMAKWGRYIEAVFEHAVQRYGKAEAEKWLWEIWNEPGFPSGYYTGTREEFLAVAEQVYLAAERVEKRHGVNLMMGLTSSGDGEEMILKRLQELGKLKLIDHHSGHFYMGASSSMRVLSDMIPDLLEFKKQFPGMKDYLIGCTEWNCNSMPTELFDRPWNASFAVKAVRMMLDGALDYATYFGLIDHPELPLPPPLFVPGGAMGLFTRGGTPVPKPVYNAFVFMNELKGGNRLTLSSSNDPIDGLAVKRPDGPLRIVLTNFDEDVSRQPYQTRVAIRIGGVSGTDYQCTRHWAADEEHGNSYGAWVKMGKPNVDDAPAKAKLIQASKCGKLRSIPVERNEKELVVQLAIPSPGIRFVELVPAGAEPTGR